MYKTLYRKYRPRSFSDVIDQDNIKNTLRNEIKFEKIAHAYLFVGSKGTGKTSCAKIFAKAINCLSPKDGDACLKCESCISIENEVSLDITELDAASNNSVNDIREICENSNFTPVKAKYRVYIIDEIHMLSQGAFAALLKTLEEPVSHVIFILATTEIHKLPATILSRCQRFDFKRIDLFSISKRLLYVASLENINLSEEAAMLIAKNSDGALRDALSLMEKLISAKEYITEEIACNLLGIASKKSIYEITDCIINKNFTKSIKILSKLYNYSKNISKILEDIIEIFKNALIFKASSDINFLNLTNEEEEKTKEIALNLTSEEILFILKSSEKTFSNIFKRSNVKLELELFFIKICFDQKNKIELNYNFLSEPIKAKEDFNKLKTLEAWPEILKSLSSKSKMVSIALMDSKAFYEDENIFIKTEKSVAKNILDDSSLVKKILDTTKKITEKDFKNVLLLENKKTIKDFIKKAKEQEIEIIEKGIKQ